MTATVIDLSSRLPQPRAACACTKHLLQALAERTAGALADSEGVLLIPRDLLADVLADIHDTTAAVLDGKPPTERGAR